MWSLQWVYNPGTLSSSLHRAPASPPSPCPDSDLRRWFKCCGRNTTLYVLRKSFVFFAPIKGKPKQTKKTQGNTSSHELILYTSVCSWLLQANCHENSKRFDCWTKCKGAEQPQQASPSVNSQNLLICQQLQSSDLQSYTCLEPSLCLDQLKCPGQNVSLSL